MRHQEFEPPEELRDAIKCFWHNVSDVGEQGSNFEVFPDGYAEIIFHFGNEFSISINGSLQPLPSPFLMGLINQPAVFHTKNHLEIIGIRCFPWTVFDLLGLPSGKDGVRIFEHPVAQIHPILNTCIQAGKIEETLAQLEKFFLSSCSRVTVDTMLVKAGCALSDANGGMPVNRVALAAHATVRTLERKFKQSSGHSVKDVAGLMRFEQVRNQLWLDPDWNLAGLAHKLGYSDQAHLSKEFKRHSGTTPGAFARKTKKGKQSFGEDFVAFIQA